MQFRISSFSMFISPEYISILCVYRILIVNKVTRNKIYGGYEIDKLHKEIQSPGKQENINDRSRNDRYESNSWRKKNYFEMKSFQFSFFSVFVESFRSERCYFAVIIIVFFVYPSDHVSNFMLIYSKYSIWKIRDSRTIMSSLHLGLYFDLYVITVPAVTSSFPVNNSIHVGTSNFNCTNSKEPCIEG